jgi:flagellar basal-body rod modification protein FlgD
MSSVSNVTSGTNIVGASDTASRVPQKTLGRDDFMKLLAVQFQMQDPMKPMEDTAFIAQTAQFSALEQSTNMVNELAQVRADQQRATANSYLGHRVTVDAGKDQTVTGDVVAVDNSGGAPRLIVGDKSYPLSAVLRVEPGVVSAPATQTSGA